MSDTPEHPAMSPYEERRWADLQKHWAKKTERRQLLSGKARATLGDAGGQIKDAGRRAGQAVSNATPEVVKDGMERPGVVTTGGAGRDR